MRGLSNGAAATSNWLANAIVSQLFLALADVLGSSGIYWLLAVVAVIAGLWAYVFLPETNGEKQPCSTSYLQPLPAVELLAWEMDDALPLAANATPRAIQRKVL